MAPSQPDATMASSDDQGTVPLKELRGQRLHLTGAQRQVLGALVAGYSVRLCQKRYGSRSRTGSHCCSRRWNATNASMDVSLKSQSVVCCCVRTHSGSGCASPSGGVLRSIMRQRSCSASQGERPARTREHCSGSGPQLGAGPSPARPDCGCARPPCQSHDLRKEHHQWQRILSIPLNISILGSVARRSDAWMRWSHF